ncbi:MAG: DNA recombination protein RmuC [Anaeromyxobacter sp.]
MVDAKCSLTAFVESVRAADAEAREAALDRHVASLRAHVKGLAGKRYPEVLRHRTLDVVMLFVPSEPAFQAALARDAALYEDAIGLGVVMVSPTTLLAALQVVRHVWRTEQQGQNARRIAEEAGKLLEKLGAFLADLDGVGTRLSQAQESFAAARSKLVTGRGNVLKKAADLARLGAPVKGEKALALVQEAGEGEDGLAGLPGSGGGPQA